MQDFERLIGKANVRHAGNRTALFPANTAEVSAVMKLCTEQSLTVSVVGGITKPWGNPAKTAVDLCMVRLSGLREHSWGDLTATFAAGTSWADTQRALAEHGQQVAFDSIKPESATVGGALATNDSGLLRMKYGSLRDLVLGMTIVLADGTIARTGGKVVKNVAGYDLPKLFTGSFGTLGIMTEATFRLHPLPKCTGTFTVRSADILPIADLTSALLKAGMLIERLQWRTETLAFALDVQFAGMRDVLQEHGDRLYAMSAGLEVEVAAESVFDTRSKLFADSSEPAEAVMLKITCLPTKLAAITAGIAQLSQLPDHHAACVTDPLGIVTAAVTAGEGNVKDILTDLRERLQSSGGSVVVLQAPAQFAELDRWGPLPAAIDIMRAIKHEFDPQRLLNPGRFVGGI